MHFDLRLFVISLILARAKGKETEGLPDHVTRHLDTDISPCQDFYAHACGNWSAVHKKDPYRSLLDQLDYDYHERLAKLLEEKSKYSGQEARFLQLPRDYYAACRRRLDMPQVLAFLERLVQIPLLGFTELTVALTAAFRLEVLVEMNANKMKDIWLQLLLRPDPEWDRNETKREPLTRPQFDVLFHQTPVWEGLSTEGFWRELSQLEREMMREDDDDDNDDDSDEGLFQDKLHTPAFWMLPWRSTGLSLSYTRRMTSMLANMSPRFLIPYILVRLRLAQGDGVATAKAWHVTRNECAEQCRELLSHPSVWLLEQDQPRLPEEPVLQGIFQTLKHRFGQKLRANRNAFDRQSQKFLLSKLHHMTLRLSVLPRWKSVQSLERRLDHHYRDMHLNASDYFGNLLVSLRSSNAEQLLELMKIVIGRPPHDRGSPFPVGAHSFGSFGSPFYVRNTNTLVVPLSLLGPPLYTPGQSELLTYSSLGFIFGHELTHGFTPDAAMYDNRGREHPGLGLQRIRRFRDQTRCLRWRFGSEQMEERFADSNGLELAYSAYFDAAEGDRRWDQDSGKTSTAKLRRQQFFLNFAQFFCSDEEESQDNDDHGTDRSRVNDAVANFEPFQEAFGCPKNKYKRLQCRLY